MPRNAISDEEGTQIAAPQTLVLYSVCNARRNFPRVFWVSSDLSKELIFLLWADDHELEDEEEEPIHGDPVDNGDNDDEEEDDDGNAALPLILGFSE